MKKDIREIIMRMREAIDQSGLSYSKLESITGLSHSTLQRYISGNTEKVPLDCVEAIAHATNVDPAWIMGWKKPKNVVPVFGDVPAGIPLEAIQDILDYEEITLKMAKTGDHFALRIKGDSMEPRMTTGDVVIIRKQDAVDNGQIAVVMINGNSATLKKFYADAGGVTLVSLNPKYEPFRFTPEQVEALPVRVIGRVVELRAKM